MDKIALGQATKVFNYYYNQALGEFGPGISIKLAQIPADYVYNEIIKNYPNNC